MTANPIAQAFIQRLTEGAGIKRFAIYAGDVLVCEGQQSKSMGNVRVRWNPGDNDVKGHLGTQSEYESLGATLKAVQRAWPDIRIVWDERTKRAEERLREAAEAAAAVEAPADTEHEDGAGDGA